MKIIWIKVLLSIYVFKSSYGPNRTFSNQSLLGGAGASQSFPLLGIALIPASTSSDWKALNKIKQLFYVGIQGELNKLCGCF